MTRNATAERLARNRYLSEISESIRKYNKWSEDQAEIAQKMYQLQGSKAILSKPEGE